MLSRNHKLRLTRGQPAGPYYVSVSTGRGSWVQWVIVHVYDRLDQALAHLREERPVR